MNSNHQINPVDADPNFATEEERLLKHWYEDGIVDKYLHKNDNSDKQFSFLDGPITANNAMGVHHGWGRTYKDLWQKYFNLKGCKQRFQNGFDCQGLWVEVEVEKDLGFKSKRDIETYGVAEFVQKCKDRVKHFSDIQTQQSKRLGYFMDWDNSYFTLSDNNNYMIWHFLKVCYENGWIYKGKDSVPWCPRCQTAISQHEMLTEDYKEIVHKSIYFELKLQNRDNEFLLVWTTTPWTLPANIAVAVDKDLEYSLVLGESNHKFWLAKDAVERVFKDSPHTIEKTVKGSELVGLKYTGLFDELSKVKKVAAENPDTFHTVIATDSNILPITATEGTGMVHTAVSAGAEDFKLGQKLNLPMIPVIDDEANYLDDLDFLSGQNAKKHPEIILDYLTKKDAEGFDCVFLIENYKHRYPACWRCKTELVWIVKEEWYIAMDKPGLVSSNKKTLRERMMAVAHKINWLPEFGLERELDWLKNMHDWLISKPNRYWGLALPLYECKHCGHFEMIGSKKELQERAVSGWDKFENHSPHKPFIDEVKIKCSKCAETVSRIGDVGNVWLDAGIIAFSTLIDPNTKELSYLTDKKYWQEWFPAKFITESFPGQFKNWFYAMIAMSTVLEDKPPFESVLGYASMLAEDGRPMHKSWGNMIEFNTGAEKIGVDVMRWLYVRQNPYQNLLFGYKSADQVRRQIILILWNSYRFFANFASLDKFAFNEKESYQYSTLDRWVLSRLENTYQDVEQSLDKYDAFHATLSLESLINDFSTWYIRLSRDRVGPSAANNEDKLAAYATMYQVLHKLSILLSPFMPFIPDRIYTNLTGETSVHLSSWPVLIKDRVDQTLENNMQKVREIVEKIHAQRKAASIPTRQPLSKATVSTKDSMSLDLVELIKKETNIENVDFNANSQDIDVVLDINITPELKIKGEVRDLIRTIQDARKSAGTRVDEWVNITLPDYPLEYEADIKAKVLAKELTKGGPLAINRL